MSDVSQGPGWWQAADLNWYPPELHADYVAPAPPVTPTLPPPATSAAEPAAQQPADLNLAATQQHPGAPAPPPPTADRPPPQIGTPQPQLGQRPRRRLTWPLIAAIVVIAAAAAGATGYFLRKPSTTSQPITPVAVTALQGLLLSPDQLNTAMGTTGMTAQANLTTMPDFSARFSDKACIALAGPAQPAVYAGSGSSAVRGQAVSEPGRKNNQPHLVVQGVVLFSSAHDAGTFFTASAQRWPACANRQFTVTPPGESGQVGTQSVGPVSNTNGTLSAPETGAGGGETGETTCQRALTVANNVAIDILACSSNQSDFPSDSAVNIAHQIAAKVPT